ncbi:hypothetical protein BKA56DRAFT_620389 [Ilyonectria sp. MPI-CAGE-AT-0026]|nr:hypothetical protein BKA56DRAFT_620389 [Ilyonectria sp. MPI-CAGE-AT-0026]
MMRLRRFMGLGLSLYFGITQAVSCGNVTISSAADAAEIRSTCTIISGDLDFTYDFNNTINLDGVEEIQGGIYHSGCRAFPETSDCPSPSPFSISSSTLTTVKGTVSLKFFNGLKELRFPNLTTVEGSITLLHLYDLKRLDITKLSRVGGILLEAPNMTTLEHESLKSFTNNAGSVSLWAAAVDSVDSFFNYPLEIAEDASDSQSFIDVYELPNLRHINIGWPRVKQVTIKGDNLGVTLGTENTTSIDIGTLSLIGNITDLDQGDVVTNLTVGQLIVKDNFDMTHLNVSFDQLSTLEINQCDGLKTLQVPPKAIDWEDFGLHIRSCLNLNLSSEYHINSDGENEKSWYWPNNITLINIDYAPTANEFFKSFLERYNETNSKIPKVLQRFSVNPALVLDFNCAPFDELNKTGVLAEYYTCYNTVDLMASLAASHEPWVFGSLFLAIAVLAFSHI